MWIVFLPANSMKAGSNPGQDDVEVLSQSDSTSYKWQENESLGRDSLILRFVGMILDSELLNTNEENVGEFELICAEGKN
ncbi:hypothetical protein AVEN_32089-1 [Araneus ventricosus]|uniref:Uncharacterized protein n=1 Tax=Araneus ventricosus TaxID=182803 RepID=A0A4Y2ECH7_ARAVE|nr:hypothetical protein AVEN_32089-1 [Araneus ventricosus]